MNEATRTKCICPWTLLGPVVDHTNDTHAAVFTTSNELIKKNFLVIYKSYITIRYNVYEYEFQPDISATAVYTAGIHTNPMPRWKF